MSVISLEQEGLIGVRPESDPDYAGPTAAITPRRTHTLVVSDMHLGSRVCRAKRLLEVLEDFNLVRLKRTHWQVLTEIRRLSKPGNGIDVVWIEGNHDRMVQGVMGRMLGLRTCKRFKFRLGGHNYLAIHGDQFDYFLVDHPLATALACRMYLLVQRYGGQEQRISRALKKRSKRFMKASLLVAKRALEYGKDQGADVVLCGHTHQPMMRRMGGVTYYNSGCWTDVPSTYLTIDEHGVTLHEC
jgi:UDP-2,3-diacylglucosamine pyrophosphatase LpxH